LIHFIECTFKLLKMNGGGERGVLTIRDFNLKRKKMAQSAYFGLLTLSLVCSNLVMRSDFG